MTAHPSAFIRSEHTQLLRKDAFIADEKSLLTTDQLRLIYEQNWFNLFVPIAYNGIGCTIPDALRLQEGIAWADGSAGWTITLCSGAAWFIGFLDNRARSDIFNDPRSCLAGSGMPTGIARLVSDGYEITGQWKYATGAPYASVFTFNCVIEEAGKILLQDDGTPCIKSFWAEREKVTILPTWQTMGMCATASHTFEITRAQVPADHAFIIDAGAAKLDDPVFRFPFLQLAESTLSVNISGMATRFLELCATFKHAREIAAAAMSQHNARREAFYGKIDRAWSQLTSSGKISAQLLAGISRDSRGLAAGARMVVNEVFPHCGMRAAARQEEINLVFRNLQTACLHTLVR